MWFYIECAAAITAPEGTNWMNLYVNADCKQETGWYGYDYIINRAVKNERTTTLMRWDAEAKEWAEVTDVAMRYADNHLELTLAREALNLTGDEFVVDFKWADNPAELADPISLCLDGDTAPNRRFNYRDIWSKE